MTSPVFALCLTCLLLRKTAHTSDRKSSASVHQESSSVLVQTGDELTLRCFYVGDVAARFYWYKQTLGHKPRLVSTHYKYETNGTLHDEFKHDPRFSLNTEKGQNHLKITDLHISDSATYYCVSSYSHKFEFAEGTTVIVKGSGVSVPAWVHQSASETVQPGGSVTLNCTVHAGTCDGEHSVYWFRQEGRAHPGLIYTQGGRRDQCERTPGTQTHTCVYNLPMESLNLSHAGTYYCAVASCGHILFGNETKLDFRDAEDSLALLRLLSGALAFTTTLVVLLAFLLYISKRNSCPWTESHARLSALPSANAEGYTNEDDLHYAALRLKKASSRRQRSDPEDECVYSSVRQ